MSKPIDIISIDNKMKYNIFFVFIINLIYAMSATGIESVPFIGALPNDAVV